MTMCIELDGMFDILVLDQNSAWHTCIHLHTIINVLVHIHVYVIVACLSVSCNYFVIQSTVFLYGALMIFVVGSSQE